MRDHAGDSEPMDYSAEVHGLQHDAGQVESPDNGSVAMVGGRVLSPEPEHLDDAFNERGGEDPHLAIAAAARKKKMMVMVGAAAITTIVVCGGLLVILPKVLSPSGPAVTYQEQGQSGKIAAPPVAAGSNANENGFGEVEAPPPPIVASVPSSPSLEGESASPTVTSGPKMATTLSEPPPRAVKPARAHALAENAPPKNAASESAPATFREAAAPSRPKPAARHRNPGRVAIVSRPVVAPPQAPVPSANLAPSVPVERAAQAPSYLPARPAPVAPVMRPLWGAPATSTPAPLAPPRDLPPAYAMPEGKQWKPLF